MTALRVGRQPDQKVSFLLEIYPGLTKAITYTVLLGVVFFQYIFPVLSILNNSENFLSKGSEPGISSAWIPDLYFK